MCIWMTVVTDWSLNFSLCMFLWQFPEFISFFSLKLLFFFSCFPLFSSTFWNNIALHNCTKWKILRLSFLSVTLNIFLHLLILWVLLLSLFSPSSSLIMLTLFFSCSFRENLLVTGSSQRGPLPLKKKAVSFKDIFQAYSEVNSRAWVDVCRCRYYMLSQVQQAEKWISLLLFLESPVISTSRNPFILHIRLEKQENNSTFSNTMNQIKIYF